MLALLLPTEKKFAVKYYLINFHNALEYFQCL